MTTYSPTASTPLEKELAAPDRLYVTVRWSGALSCERCGAALSDGGPRYVCYSVEDLFCDEPGQFWQTRRVFVCEACAGDVTYAAERLARKRGARNGSLPTWANAGRGKRR